MTDAAGIVIAIDGPAGAGKSTVARLVAGALGYRLLDTGALYRCVGLVCDQQGLDPTDAPALQRIAETLDVQFVTESGTSELRQRVVLAGRDVTHAIRTEQASQRASQVSAVSAVREALLEVQRAFGRAGRLVAEGRDMGTVVFPDAPLKIFLTASIDARAKRRHSEHPGAGSLLDTTNAIRERDARDAGRDVAPLRAAADAILVDTSTLEVPNVVAEIVRLAKERLQVTSR